MFKRTARIPMPDPRIDPRPIRSPWIFVLAALALATLTATSAWAGPEPEPPAEAWVYLR
ncbi:MAG TPA: hypothetical protein VK188_10085 [Holophaga sp.]|nr:hypothetical protein [Holophaga sp.]